MQIPGLRVHGIGAHSAVRCGVTIRLATSGRIVLALGCVVDMSLFRLSGNDIEEHDAFLS